MNWEVITDGQLLGIFATGRHGGDEAFEELVRRHLGMVLGTCRRILHHRGDAHDTAQATFQALAEKAPRLVAGQRSVAGWLYTTAWHLAMKRRRDEARRRRYELEAGAAVASAARTSEFLDQPERAELVGEVERALQLLNDAHRETLVLYYLEGLTLQQIASLTNAPPGTVAARLSRGRSQLRERLSFRGIALTLAATELVLQQLFATDTAAGHAASLGRLSIAPGQRSAEAADAAGATLTAGGGTGVIGALPRWRPVPVVATTPLTAAAALLHQFRWLAAGFVLVTGTAFAEPIIATLLEQPPAQRLSGSGGHANTYFTWSTRQSSSSNAPPSVAAVPEPTCLPVIGLAALALGRRRRSRNTPR